MLPKKESGATSQSRGRVRAESKLSKNYPVTKQMQNDFDIRNQIKHYVRTPLHNPQPPHTNAQRRWLLTSIVLCLTLP